MYHHGAMGCALGFVRISGMDSGEYGQEIRGIANATGKVWDDFAGFAVLVPFFGVNK